MATGDDECTDPSCRHHLCVGRTGAKSLSQQQAERRYDEDRPVASASQPRGHYTGRCGNCGSSNLWDDATAYGCNACGATWTFGMMEPIRRVW